MSNEDQVSCRLKRPVRLEPDGLWVDRREMRPASPGPVWYINDCPASYAAGWMWSNIPSIHVEQRVVRFNHRAIQEFGLHYGEVLLIGADHEVCPKYILVTGLAMSNAIGLNNRSASYKSGGYILKSGRTPSRPHRDGSVSDAGYIGANSNATGFPLTEAIPGAVGLIIPLYEAMLKDKCRLLLAPLYRAERYKPSWVAKRTAKFDITSHRKLVATR